MSRTMLEGDWEIRSRNPETSAGLDAIKVVARTMSLGGWAMRTLHEADHCVILAIDGT